MMVITGPNTSSCAVATSLSPSSTCGGSARPAGPVGSPPTTTCAPWAISALDLVGDRGELAVVDDRTDRGGRVSGITDAQCPDTRREPVDEFVVDAVSTMIRLARMQICPEWRNDPKIDSVDGVFEVCVVEDHEWSVAAELESESFDAGDTGDAVPDGAGSGERDRPAGGVGDDVVADLAALADEHRQQAGGQACLVEHVGEEQPAAHWCVARRFEYDGVAEREGGGDGAGGEVEWEVPGADHGDHTDRSTVDAVLLARDVRQQDPPGGVVGHRCGFEEPGTGDVPLDLGRGNVAPAS